MEKVIGSEFRYCPICKKEHMVLIKERTQEYKNRNGLNVKYKEKFFKCNNAINENAFVSRKMLEKNTKNFKKALKQKEN